VVVVVFLLALACSAPLLLVVGARSLRGGRLKIILLLLLLAFLRSSSCLPRACVLRALLPFIRLALVGALIVLHLSPLLGTVWCVETGSEKKKIDKGLGKLD
jgi:hypothetical protein